MAAANNDVPPVNTGALESDVRSAIINQKANACPMAIRLAWHASGTFEETSGTGGSDGATMRFDAEASDPANAGLSIMRDMLLAVKHNNPNVSHADIWTFAGAKAVEFTGGPKIPFKFGRKDTDSEAKCPAHGRLPDAAQGAQHLRDVFYRMGFNDQEIVALSGAHTLGRCHRVRSGFDGPWTHRPLEFNNAYFTNLLQLEWVPKKWDGPMQFEDSLTGELMMLPTDMALVQDAKFKVYVEMYAKDEQRFFDDFAKAYSRLLALGTPCQAAAVEKPRLSERDQASAEFREAAMHGSLDVVIAKSKAADVNALEQPSMRNALHKAAFWGHIGTVSALVEMKVDMNARDSNGDTPLHDAARFGHMDVVDVLLKAGCDVTVTNHHGLTAADVAAKYGKHELAAVLKSKL